MSPRRWIVVLSNNYFLGTVDGIRQGVANRENAIRFTEHGADRVAKKIPGAYATHE